jgi:hypothetical protein
VITDRDLDAQLSAAAGVQDEDLPALPEDFFAQIVAEETTAEPASVIAARQLVSDAHDARTAVPRRGRRPSRTTLVRTGIAVLGIAATWTTAVLVAPDDRAGAPDDGTAAPSGSSPAPGENSGPPSGPIEVDGMRLVATERVTFPYSLDPEPEGLTPSFARSGGRTPFGTFPVTWSAAYRADDGSGFGFTTSHEDPRVEWEFEHEFPQWSYANADVTASGSTTVDGIEADFVSATYDRPSCTYGPSTPVQTEEPAEVCTSSFTDLIWERSDGDWIWLRGADEYSDTTVLAAVAESVVDRPAPVDLQVGLAPEGWSLYGYENGHLALVSDEDPEQRLAVSLEERWRGWTTGTAFQGYSTAGPVESATVDGRPARMVVVDEGDRQEWFVAGELGGGVPFLLQAPASFTAQQVLEIAEQVTYTP